MPNVTGTEYDKLWIAKLQGYYPIFWLFKLNPVLVLYENFDGRTTQIKSLQTMHAISHMVVLW